MTHTREADAAVDLVYRSDCGRIVATLDQWRASGVPDYPRAWIYDLLERLEPSPIVSLKPRGGDRDGGRAACGARPG